MMYKVVKGYLRLEKQDLVLSDTTIITNNDTTLLVDTITNSEQIQSILMGLNT